MMVVSDMKLDLIKIIETKEDLLDGIEELIREQYKFNVSDHDIKFFGICEDCQKI